MDAYSKIKATICEFVEESNIMPNRIIIGYKLADELLNQFYDNCIPVRTLAELAKEKNCEAFYEFEGIPVKVDYNNPDILEVGYIVEWLENKY